MYVKESKIKETKMKTVFQTIRDAMEKDKTRVTADLNSFFGHKPGPAVVGDLEGKLFLLVRLG